MQQEGYTEFTVNTNTTKTVSVYIFQIMQQEGYTEFTVNNNTTKTVSVYILQRNVSGRIHRIHFK